MDLLIMPTPLAYLMVADLQVLLAYIDPGSGSLILQGIVAGLAAVMVGLSFCYNSVKSFFLRMLGKQPKATEDESNKEK